MSQFSSAWVGPDMTGVERGIKFIAGERFYRGHKIVQLFDVYPSLAQYYTDFEKNFNVDPVYYWMRENSWVPVVAVLLYGLFCYFGMEINHMLNALKASQPEAPKTNKEKDKDKNYLRVPLIAWNFMLSAFSLWGAIRTVPHILYLLSSTSFDEVVCKEPYKTYGPASTGLAVQLFILSKIPELGDTVFLILKRKDPIFLHWYHHITVLLFCWHSYVTEAAYGLFFIAMNYTVHAVMYGYYGLAAMQLLPKSYPAGGITTIQILQMFGGVTVVGYGIYYRLFGSTHFAPGTCNNVESNLAFGALIYSTYLYLFLEFAVGKYIFSKSSSKSSKSKTSSFKEE